MEVCPNTATHFVRVTEDEDLWAAVLSWLPLADAVAAAQASRTHLPLLRLSKQNVRNLRLVLVQDKGFQNPRLRILEWEDDPSLIPDRFGGIADVGLTRCLLSKVTQCLPQLHRLQIDLSPPSNSLALDISPFACATRDLSPEADGRLQGCQPWRLLECAQVHDLEMTLHHPPSIGALEEESTRDQLCDVFITLALTSWRRLTFLNVIGVAPAVLPTLLRMDLPALMVLRCGDSQSHVQSREHQHAFATWPDALLPRIARAFPTLRGLDIAYAMTPRGVSFEDVHVLCHTCRILHLDLSQVMTYVG